MSELILSTRPRYFFHAYLRAREMVVTEREKNWMIYSLPAKPARALKANLDCLRDCVQSDPVFKADLKALAQIRARRDEPSVAAACC
jgi:ArsR family transcriptional regulator, arsenate/arsenite/antimonite-responsive transcriptional repressor